MDSTLEVVRVPQVEVGTGVEVVGYTVEFTSGERANSVSTCLEASRPETKKK